MGFGLINYLRKPIIFSVTNTTYFFLFSSQNNHYIDIGVNYMFTNILFTGHGFIISYICIFYICLRFIQKIDTVSFRYHHERSINLDDNRAIFYFVSSELRPLCIWEEFTK